MSYIKTTMALLFFIFSSFLTLHAETGRDVMKKVYDESNKHKDKITDIKLSILDADKNQRVRFFNLKTKIIGDVNKSLIYFYEPATIKGTALLTHKDNEKNNTSQWIYFPSFKSLKVISGDEKNQSFMGSDFSYSDIAGRRLDEDDHNLVKEDENYYYIRSIPKDKNDPYSQLDIIINKANNTPIKITFYNQKKEVLKVLLNTKISNINGAFEPVESIMQNKITGGETLIEKRNIDVKTSIKEDELNLKALQVIS
jgi:hypothetical protein